MADRRNGNGEGREYRRKALDPLAKFGETEPRLLRPGFLIKRGRGRIIVEFAKR